MIYLKNLCKVNVVIASLFLLPIMGNAGNWSGWQLAVQNSGVDVYLRYYTHLGTSKPQVKAVNNNNKSVHVSLNKISFSLSNGGQCYQGNSSAYIGPHRYYQFSASYAPCAGLVSSSTISVTVKK